MTTERMRWMAVAMVMVLMLSGCTVNLVPDQAAGKQGQVVFNADGTVVLREVALATDEQAAVSEPETEAMPECLIKGNISQRTGEKIYHVPGSANYEQTVIDENSGERWFCTEEEAQEAGWRKAQQ